VSTHSITIWETLKFEILNAQEEFLSELSLKALHDIAKRLSEGVTQISDQLPLAQYLRPITKECNEQILKAVSEASAASFSLIVQVVVAPLLTLYQGADGITKQRALLETLTILFESAVTVFGEWSSRTLEVAAENPLLEFKDQFSEIFGQALMGTVKEEVSFRISALKGSVRAVPQRDSPERRVSRPQ
jgi:DNA repair/transcription protein MET18/MMS19